MDEQNKFYRYIDDKSILVITPKNKLIRIRCPFTVRNVSGEFFQVDAVLSENNIIFFKIGVKHVSYAQYIIQT